MTINLEKVRSATRWVLFLAVMICSGQCLRAQDRQITIFKSGQVELTTKPDGSVAYTHLAVVEVIGFSLAGVPVTPGKPFRADDDWLTKLRVKIKNISAATISHISMSFALPEAKLVYKGRPAMMGFKLDYKAGARANSESPEMTVINPGDEVELVCLTPLSAQIDSRTAVTSFTVLQYGGDITAYFVDGSIWRGSNLPVGKQ